MSIKSSLLQNLLALPTNSNFHRQAKGEYWRLKLLGWRLKETTPKEHRLVWRLGSSPFTKLRCRWLISNRRLILSKRIMKLIILYWRLCQSIWKKDRLGAWNVRHMSEVANLQIITAEIRRIKIRRKKILDGLDGNW